MTEHATTTALPHDAYIEAVHEHLASIGLHPTGATVTTPDGQQLDGVISLRPGQGYDPEQWPDGVYLGWDQHAGWSLCTEGTNRSLYPLNLDVYAYPAAVATRAHSELWDEPVSWVDEAWDGADALRSAVEAWERD